MVDARPDDSLTTEDALEQLRQAISQRLKSGPYGLLRCWTEFRQRAGSSKDGITLGEFARGLRAYGIPLKPHLIEHLHTQMDKTGDGYIQIHEFIDHVMGRWSTTANTVTTDNGIRASTLYSVDTRRDRSLGEDPDENLTIDAALSTLRRAITQRLKSGPNGLMRCWFDFRRRSGSTREGIAFREFSRGLQGYGILLASERVNELFGRMQRSGYVHIAEFIDVVMGRWKPSSNSGGLTRSNISEPPCILMRTSRRSHGEGRCCSRALHREQREEGIDVSADDALRLLRGKIAIKIASGSHGLQRSWKAFRHAAGADHHGVTEAGFELALRRFGLPVHESVCEEAFRKFDIVDGHIHEAEFFRIVMGREPHGSNASSPKAPLVHFPCCTTDDDRSSQARQTHATTGLRKSDKSPVVEASKDLKPVAKQPSGRNGKKHTLTRSSTTTALFLTSERPSIVAKSTSMHALREFRWKQRATLNGHPNSERRNQPA
mmetsp:Transcript_29372/g.94748  ORF Transcript_29372/g.94748 Transcript_29372/m.94748 type:complete len:490 (+) Transcript_29372:633-2102(+)